MNDLGPLPTETAHSKGNARLRELLEEMKRLNALTKTEDGDTEVAHVKADAILCEALRIFGQFDLVAEFDDMEKWYS